jgi:hypothetical protein
MNWITISYNDAKPDDGARDDGGPSGRVRLVAGHDGAVINVFERRGLGREAHGVNETARRHLKLYTLGRTDRSYDRRRR